MVGAEPSPQSTVTELDSSPAALTIVPLTATVPPSTMLDDDNTSPGGTTTGAGLMMAIVVWAKADSPAGSVRVTPIV